MLGEQDSVSVFAEYFYSVYSKDNNFLPHFDKRSNALLSNIEIDVVKVDRRLRALPSKYSSGLNNTPNILLKKLHSSLALPLSLIFQPILTQVVYQNYGNVLTLFQFIKGLVRNIVSKIIDP